MEELRSCLRVGVQVLRGHFSLLSILFALFLPLSFLLSSYKHNK